MCGITGGIWRTPELQIERDTLDRMVDVLAHRGPDDRGTFIEGIDSGGVALGHRRLAIVDLSPLGRQPMFSRDGAIALVFNGEIYNYEELRKPFLDAGYPFQSNTDAEVLLPLYEKHGLDFVHFLNGMFAIALWNSRQRRLILVRDRFGKKPLVYRHEKDRLVFASELKSLLQIPGVRKEIDPAALDQYLTYQYVPHPRTIYKGFSKLPPGHLAVFEADGSFRVQSYWNFDFNAEETGRSFADWSEELRSLLSDAVQLRLRSDVPLGVFLSGGIDSTIITGLVQKFSSRQVRTFSIGFPQKEYDETSYARAAAKKFGTIHEEFLVTPNVREILPKLVYHHDEPFSDSSAIPMWCLAEMTKKHVTVALAGDAGDELFAGYERYLAVGLGNRADLLPLVLRQFLAGPVMRLIPSPIHQKSKLRRFKRFLEALGMTPLERYLQWIAIFNRSRKAQLYSDEFQRTIAAQTDYDMLDFLEQAASRSTNRDAITSITLTDLLTYLPGDLMCKADTASMAHALECRAPFLDYRVVEHAIRMPISMKIHGNRGKWILRETFKDLFPPELLQRGKMGFGVPLDHWFRGELAEYVREILLDPVTLGRGYFNPDTIRRLVSEHQASQFDHAGRLWSLLFLELWLRQQEELPGGRQNRQQLVN